MQETPILRALTRQVQASRLPLHVPGHKQGKYLPTDISQWLGTSAKIDLTELQGLDNLHHPTDCILASQRLAAEYYTSDVCLYSVNGSTAGVMASIMGTIRPGQKVLFLNAFHQSAWRGLVLADAIPEFVSEEYRADMQIGVLAPLEHIERRIKEIDNLGAVYLTSPTYQGYIAPVEDIAHKVHQAGVPLIVDEAHGGHLGILSEIPSHSVALGADIVIHSVHKMLPGLTQTAWVHCKGPRVQTESIENALRMLQTTSPSYLLLASLDAVQAWLRRAESRELTHRGLKALAPIHRIMKENSEGLTLDPFRHWIPTGNLGVSQAIQQSFENQGIFVEYADHLGVLSIFGLGVTERDVDRYMSVFTQVVTKNADDVIRNGGGPSEWFSSVQRDAPTVVMSPREVFHQPATWIPIESALGRIAAAAVTPYPPGVPLVHPGQIIDADLQELLSGLARGLYEIHGLDPTGRIQVIQ